MKLDSFSHVQFGAVYKYVIVLFFDIVSLFQIWYRFIYLFVNFNAKVVKVTY